jgi:hypothetical protein
MFHSLPIISSTGKEDRLMTAHLVRSTERVNVTANVNVRN